MYICKCERVTVRHVAAGHLLLDSWGGWGGSLQLLLSINLGIGLSPAAPFPP